MAESAAMAEVVAKTALILGPEAGMSFIERQPGTKGILVLPDGSLLRSSAFREVECVH
jgi:thiamine biosynthesis lipoprotein ApbE